MTNCNLLVVDDDKDTCANLHDILIEFGYEVDLAYDGNQALDLFRQHSHRVVLLDYKLPCMTGVELFQRMRGIRKNVNALLVTGFASQETTQCALAAGVRRVLSKPVEVKLLMPLIEDACNN